MPRKADADDEDCINNDNSDKKSTATATPAVESTVAEKNDEGIMETSAPKEHGNVTSRPLGKL